MNRTWISSLLLLLAIVGLGASSNVAVAKNARSTQYPFYTVETKSKVAWIDISSSGTLATQASEVDDAFEPKIDLGFTFPFYGFERQFISISPNGFIMLDPVTCSIGFCNWREDESYTQYIAPFMTDFNPSVYEESKIYYKIENSENQVDKRVIVQWTNLHLFNDALAEGYTFQAIIHQHGKIDFIYKDIPQDPSSISTFFNNKTIYFPDLVVGVQETVYLHDSETPSHQKASISFSQLSTETSITLTALPSCQSFVGCGGCIDFGRAMIRDDVSFCGWCPSSKKCVSTWSRLSLESPYCPAEEELFRETCSNSATIAIAIVVPIVSVLIIAIAVVAIVYIVRRYGYRGGTTHDALPGANNSPNNNVELEDQKN